MAWCCLPPLDSPCHQRECNSTCVTEDDSSVPPGTPVPGGWPPAVIAGGLVPPAVARGVSSTVPGASAPGIGPPAPLAGGPLGAIIGGHPLPREGVAEWVDPPKNTAPWSDQGSRAVRKNRYGKPSWRERAAPNAFQGRGIWQSSGGEGGQFCRLLPREGRDCRRGEELPNTRLRAG